MGKTRISVKRARKLLGILAKGIPDEQLEKELLVAEYLMTVFFDDLKSKKSSRSYVY